jgi:hypothetical protein
MSTDNGKPLDWDDSISNDGKDFVLLPEADYDFIVKSLERALKTGTANGDVKIAKLVLEIEHEGKKHEVRENLTLHSKFEWKLCQFFTCIGQRKHGEELKPQWNKVPGAKGKVKIIQKAVPSTKKPGETNTFNNVDKFLDPSAALSDDQF